MLLNFIVNNIPLELEEYDETVINKLMYDDDFTFHFFGKAIRERKLTIYGLYPSELENGLRIERGVTTVGRAEQDNCENYANENTCPNYDSESQSELQGGIIWSQRRPTCIDIEATEKMLTLREKYSKLFDDKKTTKHQLWIRIAEDLKKAGYNIECGKIGGEKCRQKFANLQKMYTKFIQHVNKTGNERKEPPQFYEKLHNILGGKHKFFPVAVYDSLATDNILNNYRAVEPETAVDRLSGCTFDESALPTVQNIQSDVESQSISSINSDKEMNAPNRFSTTKKRIRPSKEDKLIKAIQEINENTTRNIVESTERTNTLIQEQNDLLRRQNEQRDKLIELFGEMVNGLK